MLVKYYNESHNIPSLQVIWLLFKRRNIENIANSNATVLLPVLYDNMMRLHEIWFNMIYSVTHVSQVKTDFFSIKNS